MKLVSIESGQFKLDGGAMFGVVPKKLWNKLVPSDENNLCTWSMRCLLIDSGDRRMLIDCGMGDKQDDKFMGHYEPSGTDLMSNLRAAGYAPEDITDLFLTHLHFDHCGGAVKREDDGTLKPAFPNAVVWSNERHWNWAVHPNAREKASFLKENMLPLQEHGVLKFLSEGESPMENMEVLWVNGHTEAMMLPIIQTPNAKVAYMADLLPAAAHIPLPFIMGYDIRPLITLEEKTSFLEKAVEENMTLFFEHDAVHECCNLQMTEKGVRPKDFFRINSL
jgi:glyoxylase-like metal-dependent hydrolase (beta-lactamase superfamily II)